MIPPHVPLTPNGAVTGIGSLPFTDPEAAVDFVAHASPRIPFWPQLPRHAPEEGIVEQGLGAVTDLVAPRHGAYGYRVKPGALDDVLTRLARASGVLDADHAAGFFAFERALWQGRFPHAVALKGQIEGPVTLAFHLFHEDHAFAEDPELLDAVTRHVSALAGWQVRRLARFGLPVMMFVDEPAMHLADARPELSDALARVVHHVRAEGARAGVHCCADLAFRDVVRTGPDVLSFDAHHALEAGLADADVRAFLDAGGSLALGLVPTRATRPTPPDVLFQRWLTAACGARDVRDLARQCMITATCGLGLVDEAAARASFETARRVGGLVERLATAPAVAV